MADRPFPAPAPRRAPSAERFGVRDAEAATLALGDGTRLAADVWRPDAPGRFPVLLMRQPYGRRIASTVVLAHPAWYAARGYVVVVQDVRGRGGSTGRFRLLADDAADGAATLAWAADLPGCDGRVGTYGFSYQGITQFLALAGALRAGTKRPDAMAPAMGGWTIRDDWVAPGGSLRLSLAQIWAAQMGAEQARLAGDAEAHADLVALARGAPWNGPVPARPAALERHARYHHFADWLADDPAYWAGIAPAAALDGLAFDVPALHVGGSMDFMLAGTLAAHARFRVAGAAPQRLLVGPWTHIPWGRRGVGRDFGPDAGSTVDVEQAAFFDLHLKGRGEPGAPVRLYDVGAARWRDFDALPEPAPTVLHLASDGLAATTATDGRLDPDPGPAETDRLVHDPWRPAPWVGGAVGDPAGHCDRAGLDDRTDVAVYTSGPVARPVLLAGRVEARLCVDCDRPSHDLHVALSLVDPRGGAMVLATGHRVVDAPGAARPQAIDVGVVCCTVPPGHALRLSVQAAAFPAHAVNPGTGARARDAAAIDAVVTTLAIRHGGGSPSRLCLPVLEERP